MVMAPITSLQASKTIKDLEAAPDRVEMLEAVTRQVSPIVRAANTDYPNMMAPITPTIGRHPAGRSIVPAANADYPH